MYQMSVSSYWDTEILRTAKYGFVKRHFHLGDQLLHCKLPLTWRNPTKLVVDYMFLYTLQMQLMIEY